MSDTVLKLLEDADHEVAEPVDIKVFRDFEEQARPEVKNRILGWAVAAVIVVSILLYLMYQIVDQ